MHTILIEDIKAIKKIKARKSFLEKKLRLELEIDKKSIILSGSEIEEYEADKVFKAISSGFDIETSLFLKDENYVFEVINIKDLTKRGNLSQVRARIIGRKGKTLKVLQELTECNIILRDNHIYIIGPAERIKDCLNGLKKLIHGSKQSSTYSYLEKQRKHPDSLDFGLKIKPKSKNV